MLPPTDVYSIVVNNKDEFPIMVTVLYKGADGKEESKQKDIESNESAKFEEIEYDAGSSKAVMAVFRVNITSAGPSNALHNHEAPFNVSSPTKGYVFDISTGEGGKLGIEHHSP
ncbi:hypothetical protein SARC_10496 [Sphaeroforma arctica JP610]|uniref:Uncharacterized protein n=1 Tax=Sphaeroforma arctica JP610 TaxID=667725 RepID=A0A0L0FLY7_9EUKA|nr:hypothetical protein SARC_10496 [Sphaeroforma arctica JP610]KNC77033.1 hypothetical protein SARC_10496 [Sphaeroforma arctica JP610]|eukprot:XP_014150935.1 hypothetical protein SARC_10496 [Sphaeroforma arctica JP610]